MKKINLKILRDISTQRWQFAALVLIILLGVMSYGGMVGMIDDVETSLNRTLERLRFGDFSVRIEGTVPEGLSGKAKEIEGVEGVVGRLVMDVGLNISEENQAHARLIGLPAEKQPAVNQLYLREGRYFKDGDGLVALLDHHFAGYYGFGPGSVLHPIVNGETLDVTVVGVVVSPEYLMSVSSRENLLPSPSGFAVLFMPLPELQRIFRAEGEINEIDVQLTDASRADMDGAIEAVRGIVGEDAVRSVAKGVNNPSYSLLMMDLEDGREMMGMIPAMFLIIAAMSIYVLLNRMVRAQRAQIGVIRALGYTRGAVMRHFILFSVIVGLVGSVIGFALSYPVGRAFAQAYAEEFGLPFISVRFHLGAAIGAIGMSLLVCLLAGLFPARDSARVSPAQAIRFDPSTSLVRGSVPLLERLLARFLRLGTGTKIALRNVFRNRRRSLTTALGFVFALVVLLSCWALFDAMGHMFKVQFEETDLWDVHANFYQPKFPDLLKEIRSWPGVEAAEPVLESPTTLRSGSSSEESFLTAIQPNASLHRFQLPKGETPDRVLAPGHVLLNGILAKKLGVETGENISIRTPMGLHEMIVEAENHEIMSPGIYTNLTWVQDELLGGVRLFNGVLIKAQASEQREVRKRLYRIPGVASVELKAETAAGWRSLMGLYYVMMGSFLVFALIIAGAVVFNTMTVNVLERQREIATMRALGQSRGRIARMITLENVLTGLLALIPGLLLGSAATYYFFQVWSSSAEFNFPYYISPQSYVVVSVLVFATALLSQLPAIRRVNRMSLAEATKITT